MPKRQQPQSSQHSCWEIKALKRRPNAAEAEELLRRVAAQVEPIMRKRKWRVTELQEFFPKNAGLLGMNVNRSKILIRLRPASSPDSFFPFDHCLGTMLHELTHMVIGPHNVEFYKLLDEIRDECEGLMAKGISGARDAHAFAGQGTRAGGDRPLGADARTLALLAAEKRAKAQRIMGGGGRRLGGGRVSSSRSQRDIVADAAERRKRDDDTCRAVLCGKVIDMSLDDDDVEEDEDEEEKKVEMDGPVPRAGRRRGGAAAAATAGGGGGVVAAAAQRPASRPPRRGGHDRPPSARVGVAAAAASVPPSSVLPNGFDPCKPLFSSGGNARAAITLAGAGAPEAEEQQRRRAAAAAAELRAAEDAALAAALVQREADAWPGLQQALASSVERGGGGAAAAASSAHDVIDMTGDSPPPRASPAAAAAWSCPRCTFVNQGGAACCEMCGALPTEPPPGKRARGEPPNAPAAAAEASVLAWTCPCCTLQNRPLFLSCGACGEERGADDEE